MATQSPEKTILTGTIRIVGNEPFTKVVLTVEMHPAASTKNMDYLIVGPLKDSLRRDYQGKVMTLEGTLCSSPDPAFKNCFNPVAVVNSVSGAHER